MLVGLQYGRGAAALAVVLFHAAGTVSAYWSPVPFLSLFKEGHAGVYFFFVLSGFIIFHAHSKDIGKPNLVPRYLQKRAIRIYPVYWVFVCLALAAELALGRSEQYFNPAFTIGLVTLLPFNGAQGNLAVAWTLFHEVLFYLVFVSLIASKRVGVALLVGWWLACLAQSVVAFPLPAPLAVLFNPINTLFGLGMFAALVDRERRVPALPVLLVGGVAFTVLWAFGGSYEGDLSLPYGIAAAMLVYGLASLKPSESWAAKVGTFLGNASYSIYLSHFLTLSVLAKLLSSRVPSPLGFIVLVVVALAVGCLCHLVIERPLLRAAARG